MPNLTTKGSASLEFDADIMEFTVILEEKSTDSSSALNKVQSQTEQFMEEFIKIGICPEKVILIDGGISTDYNSDNYKAKKSLIIESNIDSSLCAYICALIKSNTANIKYEIKYKLANEEEAMKKVIQAAVEHSRHQAEIIAESLGMKITGVDSVNENLYAKRNMAKSVCIEGNEIQIPKFFKSDTPLLDRASIPKITKSIENITTWIVS